jgi:hypothetical protein
MYAGKEQILSHVMLNAVQLSTVESLTFELSFNCYPSLLIIRGKINCISGLPGTDK